MNTITTTQAEELLSRAEAAHAQYPQYANHWQGAEWKPVRFLRTVRTKAGLAFEAGDLAIAKPGREGFVTAYSERNQIDMSVPASDVEWLTVVEPVTEVGEFSLAGGLFTGPALYMEQQGNAKLDRILAGHDPVFNATAHLSPSIETAILVAMQTDYAGWKGTRSLFG